MRVLVAMSGGVDSSVAAALLMDKGHEVAGATMLLTDLPGAAQAVNDARCVAEALGISFRMLDLRAAFLREVIDPFVASYLAGQTPNPCVRCNRLIKFGNLLDAALADGFDAVATGHYARVEASPDGQWMLYADTNQRKDQSYALYHLTQHQLAHILFPLSGMTKDEVRALASQRKLPVANKPDSQDICFIPGGDYADFISGAAARLPQAGDILDAQGNVVARHNGFWRYTVGQRKGLGGVHVEKMYVISVDASRNTVTIGRNEDVFSPTCRVRDVRFSGTAPTLPCCAKVKVRYGARPALAQLKAIDGSEDVLVLFDTPERAVTPGQSAVFYDNGRVLGGGTIV